MSRSFALDDTLHAYVVAHSTPLDPVQAELVETTARLGDVAGMQTGPDQVVLLTLLTRAIGARSAIEVGTFTGASALAIAKGLPADGRLVCCDVSEEWTSIARDAWAAAGVADRIDLRIGPAQATLDTEIELVSVFWNSATPVRSIAVTSVRTLTASTACAAGAPSNTAVRTAATGNARRKLARRGRRPMQNNAAPNQLMGVVKPLKISRNRGHRDAQAALPR